MSFIPDGRDAATSVVVESRVESANLLLELEELAVRALAEHLLLEREVALELVDELELRHLADRLAARLERELHAVVLDLSGQQQRASR